MDTNEPTVVIKTTADLVEAVKNKDQIGFKKIFNQVIHEKCVALINEVDSEIKVQASDLPIFEKDEDDEEDTDEETKKKKSKDDGKFGKPKEDTDDDEDDEDNE